MRTGRFYQIAAPPSPLQLLGINLAKGERNGEHKADLTLQHHLTYGLPYMLLCEVVIAHFSRPPRGPIRAWESPPLTCRPLGHQSAALVPAWSWTRPGSAADGGLLR